MFDFCEDHKIGNEEFPKVLYDTDSCPLCEALEEIDDLEYDKPYYHKLITDLTINLDKHPEGYEGFCRCKYCLQYYEGRPDMYGCNCETCFDLGFGRGKRDENYLPDINDDPKLLARNSVKFELIDTGDTYTICEIDDTCMVTLMNFDKPSQRNKSFSYNDLREKFRIKKDDKKD